jgi:hypothetical protein
MFRGRCFCQNGRMLEKLSGIVLVAQPGRMLTSLRVMLKSYFPKIELVQIDDLDTLMWLPVIDRPLLVLIDADLPEDEGWRIGDEILQNCPQHHAVILIHTQQQKQRAYAAGLDSLPLEGMSAANLSDVLRIFWTV